MATHISEYVEWKSGAGTPVKYSFSIDADIDVVSLVGQLATINVVGSVQVTNNPLNSRNSWAASDFAVLVPGDVSVETHPFVYGTRYYQHSIPFLPDPQNGDASKMLAQFRGDTWISDPSNNRNKVSLWTKDNGLELDASSSDNTWTFPIDTTFEITINESGNTPILAWYTSGANSATDYTWLTRQVWASWFDIDYRPGAVFDGNVWLSHDRTAGTCHVFDGAKFVVMETFGGPIAKGTPPSTYYNNRWYNMNKYGKES